MMYGFVMQQRRNTAHMLAENFLFSHTTTDEASQMPKSESNMACSHTTCGLADGYNFIFVVAAAFTMSGFSGIQGTIPCELRVPAYVQDPALLSVT
jgi:hypothetical protein